MKSFGFENFNKFESFTPSEFADVNIFVGGNNAGKSTCVKALMVICDFFKNWKTGNNEINLSQLQSCKTLHIRTFEEILNYNRQNDEMSFFMSLNDFELRVSIIQVSDQIGKVTRVELSKGNLKTSDDFVVDFDFIEGQVTLDVDASIFKNEKFQEMWGRGDDHLSDIFKQYNDLLSSGGYSQLYESEKKNLDENCKMITNAVVSNFVKDSVIEKLIQRMENTFKQVFVSKIFDGKTRIQISKELPSNILSSSDNRSYYLSKILGEAYVNDMVLLIYPFVSSVRQYTANIIRRFENAFDYLDVSYCSIINISLDRVYLQKDTGDVSQALKEYFNEEEKSDEKQKTEIHGWITFWLRKFNIGENFEIKPYKHEAMYSDVFQGGKSLRLNSLGMGSIHMYILLLKMATFISRLKRTNVGVKSRKEKVILLIEEPELNLHPDLHVLLTDLFLDAYKQFGIQIIVETHSEYLIRQTQVIVSSLKNGQPNPFKVFYFPMQGTPYEMRYREDGKFSNKFGEGFFDVASSLAFKLF